MLQVTENLTKIIFSDTKVKKILVRRTNFLIQEVGGIVMAGFRCGLK